MQREDVTIEYRSLSDAHVHKFLRVASIGIELQIERLKWYSTMALEPDHHQQWIAAMFGKMQFELDDSPHPWLLQIKSDFQAISQLEGGEDISGLLQADPLRLFKDSELAKEYSHLDFAFLRFQSFGHCVQPPGTLVENDHVQNQKQLLFSRTTKTSAACDQQRK